jgi:hypothetical protein
MDRISFRQTDTLTEGKDPMLARAIEVAIRDINSAESSISSKLGSLQSRLNYVREHLDKSLNLNNLGEFQSLPGDIDMLIAQRQQAWQLLGAILSEDEIKSLLPQDAS